MSFIDTLTLPSTETEKVTAFEAFKNAGIPTTKNEEWKFTNISRVLKSDFSTVANTPESDVTTILNDGLEGNKLVILNGVYNTKLSSIISTNITIEAIDTALASNATAKSFFNKTFTEKDAFAELNTALFTSGVFIHVAKSTTVAETTYIYYINDATKENIITNPRNLIVAEQNTEATIVSFYKTLGENKSFVNEITEVNVAKDARITCTKLQDDSYNASQVNTTQVAQAGNSVFTGNVFSFSGEMIRNNLNISLDGEHIESHMNGLYLLNEKTHVDNHTVADHRFPNCESHELYKGILDDKSNGVFNGKIFVRPDAQQTNAFQSNKNILMSADAKVNTKPQLEIWADDVSCSHGCTIGQLDEEALFYLKARGISATKAKSLMMEAFAGEVTERIKTEGLKEKIEQIILDRFS